MTELVFVDASVTRSIVPCDFASNNGNRNHARVPWSTTVSRTTAEYCGSKALLVKWPRTPTGGRFDEIANFEVANGDLWTR